MSTLRVDAIRHNSATSDAITTAADGTCTAKLTSIGGGGLSHRNIIINGAMTLAQRGSSSTSDGIHTVDRFAKDENGTDESLTQAQVDVASGTTPYTLGFRKAFKLTNGNQTSGAGSADRATAEYKIEAQDIANSGWNYLSTSSYITISYWVKSSVAQNFYNTFGTDDGTKQRYTTETGSLSADTWTKITKTIPGNSNLTFNNDNGEGLEITWEIFRGTDQTGSMSLNAWAASNNNLRTPDQTSTWWTTNDATFEITGVQLEVGDTATTFEHLTFAEELTLCERYYQIIKPTIGEAQNTTNIQGVLRANPAMRATPSASILNNSNNVNLAGSGPNSVTSIGTIYYNGTTGGWAEMGGTGFTQHRNYFILGDKFAFSAEL